MYYLSSALLALPAFALAQGNYGQSGSKTTAAGAKTTSTASSSGAIHSIAVGQGGLKFVPDSITADVGDQVEFHFVESDHTVVEGAFNKPCQPLDSSAFYSGRPQGNLPFTITVNSTDPMWFYCSVPSHCQAGMVGVINPPSGETVDDYAAAAAKTSKSSAPAKVQGGVYAAAKPASGSTGGTTTTSPSMASSASAASSPSQSTGAAAGGYLMGSIGVGLPVGLLVYALF